MSAPVDQELLADPAELAVKTGRPADDPELLYALRSASRDFAGAVRSPVRRVVGDVVRLDGSGTTVLLLPCAPVIAVTTVEVDGAALTAGTDFDWSEDGMLERSAGWPRKLRAVRVVYDHGFDPIPTDIQDAVLQKAEMGLNVTPGLSSIIVGGETLTFATKQGASVTGVTETWTRTVEKYQLNRGDRS